MAKFSWCHRRLRISIAPPARVSMQGFMRPGFSYRFSTRSLAMASSQPDATISHKVGIFNHYSSGRRRLALRPRLSEAGSKRERLEGKTGAAIKGRARPHGRKVWPGWGRRTFPPLLARVAGLRGGAASKARWPGSRTGQRWPPASRRSSNVLLEYP